MTGKKIEGCGSEAGATRGTSEGIGLEFWASSAEKRRRISAESPGVVCLEHAEKQQLFCEDDQKLVCMLCVTLDHRDHSFCSIEKAASDHKGKLQGPLQELKSKLENLTSKIPSIDLTKQKLQSKAKETERRIKKEFEKLHQFLREKEQTRISALREEEKEKIKRRDEEIKVIRDLCSDLSERIQKIEKDFKSNDGLFLHNIRDIEMRAQYTAQDPQVDSASVIDEAKHLGNLRFRVWETMKDICHYLWRPLELCDCDTTCCATMPLFTNMTLINGSEIHTYIY
ncbi:E3 ubiquitin-protein ligase TRIM35-like [Hoplias malabaricus]|uniref:E3 ubiquitin-protein ligase TRIM35-like n=1 Tax=Hoplias malabaricus TaxID=27720 RepID=UPI0034631175